MTPSNKEMQQRKTCELYVYVLVSQGKEVPDMILECACSYDYLVNCASELSKELQSLDRDTFETLVNSKSKEARALSQWWEMWQEADRLREVIAKTCL